MAKYKVSNPKQLEFISVDFSRQLIAGSLEHTINYLFEERLDLSGFNRYFNNDITGAPAYHPKVLLKIILFGYSRGIISSRKIAIACQENIVFKTLSEGFVPHFTFIADFIHSYEDEIKKLFTEVIMVCSELDLIGGEFMAADGCKLPSNASKEWSGKFSDLKKKEVKIRQTLNLLIEKHKANDSKVAEEIFQNRIDILNRKADKIKEYLESNEKKMGSRGLEIQSNLTDNESGRIKGPHGVIQGYNGIAMSDSKEQVVLHAEAFGGVNESQFLQKFVENAKVHLESTKLGKTFFRNCIFIADTGFFSEDNCKFFSDEKIDAYIPDQHFRKRDPRFLDRDRFKDPTKQSRFMLADFKYDSEKNQYLCPNGQSLLFRTVRKLGNTSGPLYVSNKTKCSACSLRKQCLKNEKTKFRSLYISKPKHGWNYSQEMIKKIDTPLGRDIYSKRMGIIEPVFANICYAKGMSRFNYRSKRKVNCQWLLYCMVHNISKVSKALQPKAS